MKKLWLAPALAFMLCSGFLCTGTQIHKAKLANADVATTLNTVTKTIIQLTQQGTMSPAEEQAILPHISDATVLSDRMQTCTNTTKTASILACATPLFTAIQSDLTAASFGLKNPTAQATYSSVIGAVQVALDSLKSYTGGQ
jgi:hypothetical protein